MREREPVNDFGDTSLRRQRQAGTEGADRVPRGGVETAAQSPPSPEAAPKFEDWLLGVASWYVSHEGSRVVADKTPAPAGP